MADPSAVDYVDLFLFEPLDVDALAASLEVPASERESILREFLPRNSASLPASPQTNSSNSRVLSRRSLAEEAPNTPSVGGPAGVEPKVTSRVRRPLTGLLLRKNSAS